MENSNNGTVKIIGAVLIGAAVGASLGILFAPHKGSKTRRRLMEKGDDLTASIKDKFEHFIKELNVEIACLKDKAKEMADSVKNDPLGS